jgi:hypothetical protein
MYLLSWASGSHAVSDLRLCTVESTDQRSHPLTKLLMHDLTPLRTAGITTGRIAAHILLWANGDGALRSESSSGSTEIRSVFMSSGPGSKERTSRLFLTRFGVRYFSARIIVATCGLPLPFQVALQAPAAVTIW